jgi:hypothetical protein
MFNRYGKPIQVDYFTEMNSFNKLLNDIQNGIIMNMNKREDSFIDEIDSFKNFIKNVSSYFVGKTNEQNIYQHILDFNHLTSMTNSYKKRYFFTDIAGVLSKNLTVYNTIIIYNYLFDFLNSKNNTTKDKTNKVAIMNIHSQYDQLLQRYNLKSVDEYYDDNNSIAIDKAKINECISLNKMVQQNIDTINNIKINTLKKKKNYELFESVDYFYPEYKKEGNIINRNKTEKANIYKKNQDGITPSIFFNSTTPSMPHLTLRQYTCKNRKMFVNREKDFVYEAKKCNMMDDVSAWISDTFNQNES